MPERLSFTKTTTGEEHFADEAKRLRKQAQGIPPGIERERLLRRARQAEAATRMTEWRTSRALQAPKEAQ
jgi:predicted trehalose synthase